MTPEPPKIFRRTACPHSGQSFTGSSDMFCTRSKIYPHVLHSYSYVGIHKTS
jgi:hypothetical protein